MYEFSIGAFFLGFLILLVGVAFMRWHQWVADNFGDGVSSYDRYKLWALVTCVVGFVVMVNLHTPLLIWLVELVFP
jgi:uncharacterized membrane protein